MVMASSVFSKSLIRRLSVVSSSLPRCSPTTTTSSSSSSSLLGSSSPLPEAPAAPSLKSSGGGGLCSPARAPNPLKPSLVFRVLFFSSQPSDLEEGPAAVDYRSILAEDEFHRLADATIHDLQEKFEEYGDDVQIDGFDIDYGNQVLTLKLGGLGTYVINKQTPNRQIWVSSPVSGPSRFDWDRTSQAWVYRRTKAKLLQLLEDEFEQLCGKPISLS